MATMYISTESGIGHTQLQCSYHSHIYGSFSAPHYALHIHTHLTSIHLEHQRHSFEDAFLILVQHVHTTSERPTQRLVHRLWWQRRESEKPPSASCPKYSPSVSPLDCSLPAWQGPAQGHPSSRGSGICPTTQQFRLEVHFWSDKPKTTE